jgi:hypothetical protein
VSLRMTLANRTSKTPHTPGRLCGVLRYRVVYRDDRPSLRIAIQRQPAQNGPATSDINVPPTSVFVSGQCGCHNHPNASTDGKVIRKPARSAPYQYVRIGRQRPSITPPTAPANP